MTQEFFIQLEDFGKPDEPSKKRLRRYFDELPKGRYYVKIEDKTKRTLNQNDYLHTIFPLIQKGLYDNGYRGIKTPLQAKEVCKELFLSYEERNEITGAKIKMVRRTRDLTKAEMCVFIDEIIEWASEYLGVVVPPPNSQTEFTYFTNNNAA